MVQRPPDVAQALHHGPQVRVGRRVRSWPLCFIGLPYCDWQGLRSDLDPHGVPPRHLREVGPPPRDVQGGVGRDVREYILFVEGPRHVLRVAPVVVHHVERFVVSLLHGPEVDAVAAVVDPHASHVIQAYRRVRAVDGLQHVPAGLHLHREAGPVRRVQHRLEVAPRRGLPVLVGGAVHIVQRAPRVRLVRVQHRGRRVVDLHPQDLRLVVHEPHGPLPKVLVLDAVVHAHVVLHGAAVGDFLRDACVVRQALVACGVDPDGLYRLHHGVDLRYARHHDLSRDPRRLHSVRLDVGDVVRLLPEVRVRLVVRAREERVYHGVVGLLRRAQDPDEVHAVVQPELQLHPLALRVRRDLLVEELARLLVHRVDAAPPPPFLVHVRVPVGEPRDPVLERVLSPRVEHVLLLRSGADVGVAHRGKQRDRGGACPRLQLLLRVGRRPLHRLHEAGPWILLQEDELPHVLAVGSRGVVAPLRAVVQQAGVHRVQQLQPHVRLAVVLQVGLHVDAVVVFDRLLVNDDAKLPPPVGQPGALLARHKVLHAPRVDVLVDSPPWQRVRVTLHRADALGGVERPALRELELGRDEGLHDLVVLLLVDVFAPSHRVQRLQLHLALALDVRQVLLHVVQRHPLDVAELVHVPLVV